MLYMSEALEHGPDVVSDNNISDGVKRPPASVSATTTRIS